MNETSAGAAREILLAAIRAVDPRELTRSALQDASGLSDGVEIVAAGKAAAAMVRGAVDALGSAVRGGVAIAPDESPALPRSIWTFQGGHPLPNDAGVRGARAVMRLVENDAHAAPLIVLLSGGASALMTIPPNGVPLADIVEVSRALMAAGADIRELNCVRKHLDQLKGGQLARRVAPARAVRALVLSDVIGDPLDVIASGPLVPDPTTFDDAITILRTRAVWDSAAQSVRAHLLAGAHGDRRETPKAGDPCFANVRVEVIGNNALAVHGAAAEAARHGFDVEIESAPVSGEARKAGAAFARRLLDARARAKPARPVCIVGGGETTVTVAGSGIGGRNLEFAAAAALAIDGDARVTIGSVGTDGRDGPTDAAGAVVDGSSAAAARKAGAELAAHLATNDTLRALDAAGAVVRTGPTGTNVMDVFVGIVTPR